MMIDGTSPATSLEHFSYDNKIVKYFAYATSFWGLVGMSVGLLAALQMVFPALNFTAVTTFGRIRPLHTNAVIFAFVGNGMFMGIYYSLQRLCKARMFSDKLSWFNFWGWQADHRRRGHHAAAGPDHQQGIRRAGMADRHRHRRSSGWSSASTCSAPSCKRRERHMYVAIWFYIATWRHGRRAAHRQLAWNARRAVQELPGVCRRAGRAGAMVVRPQRRRVLPHHALPGLDVLLPAQGGEPPGLLLPAVDHPLLGADLHLHLGRARITCSTPRCPTGRNRWAWCSRIMLIAPSWGGMLNGLLTLRGAWDKVRQDPVLKFMVVAVTAYGMATLEGPTAGDQERQRPLALHRLDDRARAHRRAGLERLSDLRMLYWLFPRLYNTKLWSTKLANYHFWIGPLGMMFYVVPMYWAGGRRA